ncbi:hypothetical protein Ciccas_004300 [Cichlidogyrus casuarinus]|uniref:cGMP-dependent protein kinase interacting domain-containing protein n=1 Tax=Cichlidogyrus casuarinus TaxID=1844966 RepID=A0ABD2QFB9_9PLAT
MTLLQDLSPYSSSTTAGYMSGSSSNNLDYKQLYEAECRETSELRSKVDKCQSEIKIARKKIEQAKSCPASSASVSQQWRSSDYDTREKDRLRLEGDKLRAENRALTRVVSRLKRDN